MTEKMNRRRLEKQYARQLEERLQQRDREGFIETLRLLGIKYDSPEFQKALKLFDRQAGFL